MAFASMFLVFLFVVIIILGISFLLGMILLIVGLANSGKVKKNKKKWPVVLSVVGALTMIPPVIITLIAVIAASKYNYDIEHMLDKYGTVAQAWQHVEVVDTKAANQSLDLLFAAADANNRDEFVANFSQEMREDPRFNDAVDKFFEAYPGGFSGKDYYYNAHGGTTAGPDWKGAKRGYECDVDGVHYYITIGFVYHSDEHPEKVGVNYLTIMNIEGQAMYSYGDTEINKNNEDIFLMCYLPTSDEVSARRIDRYAYLWNENDNPLMTKEEMREYLSQYETLQEAIDAGGIGQPNAIPINNGFELGSYYYELKSVDGEPRYAEINTKGHFGKIISAYECTDTTADFDDPIITHKNGS